MSYASAAAEKGPGSTKVDKPAEVEVTENPEGNVEAVKEDADKLKESALGGKVVIEEKVNDIKKDLPKLGDDLKKQEKEARKKIKKEYENNKGPVIDFFKNIGNKLSDAAAYLANATYSTGVKTTEELKNPVVATQTVVGIGAITAIVVGIQERSKIFKNKTDGEITAILAGVVGFVLLDGYLFATNYSKYDKRSLK